MLVRDRVVVVTGGGNGIGAALARRFAADGAAGVLVADLDGAAAEAVAAGLTGTKALAVRADVSVAGEVAELVVTAERELGPVDLFCSNAGMSACTSLEEATAQDWERSWAVNLMAHVHAAKAVLPSMLDRGEGYLLNTISAAGLLVSVDDPVYTASKHAALGFAEYLVATYGSQGIGVSALCPLAVRTDMLMSRVEQGKRTAVAVLASGPLLEPDDIAEAVTKGLAAEQFLILPHPEVAALAELRITNHRRWLSWFRRHTDGLSR